MPVIYTSRLPQITAELEPKVSRALRKSAADMVTYMHGHHAYTNRTGNLTASSSWRSEGPLRVVILNDANYAAYVELGTRRMSPRPFMRPAFDTMIPRLQANLAKVLV